MSITGYAIVNSAEKYSGVKYFEGNPQSPQNGFDCSGLVQRAMADLGVKIGRTTSVQLADANSHVVGANIGTDINQALQGDIIHYVGHEEIFIGWDQRGAPMVFSEATNGTTAGVRGKTPWPIVGIVRYADAGPGPRIGSYGAVSPGGPGANKDTPVQTGGDPGYAIPSDPLTAIGSSISSLVDVVTTISKLFTFILDPKNWWRVGLAVFGVALLILALLRLTKTPTSAVINPATIGKVKDLA